MIEGMKRTFVAGEDLAAYRRVKLSGSTVVYADDDDRGIGVTEFAADSGDDITVRMFNAGGTFEIMTSGAVTAGAKVFATADGKIDDAVATIFIGYACAAATANGDVIEILPDALMGTATT